MSQTIAVNDLTDVESDALADFVECIARHTSQSFLDTIEIIRYNSREDVFTLELEPVTDESYHDIGHAFGRNMVSHGYAMVGAHPDFDEDDRTITVYTFAAVRCLDRHDDLSLNDMDRRAVDPSRTDDELRDAIESLGIDPETVLDRRPSVAERVNKDLHDFTMDIGLESE